MHMTQENQQLKNTIVDMAGQMSALQKRHDHLIGIVWHHVDSMTWAYGKAWLANENEYTARVKGAIENLSHYCDFQIPLGMNMEPKSDNEFWPY